MSGSVAEQLVNVVLNQGGFDATQTDVLGWLDQRHRLMCSRAKCVRKLISLGSTVAGTQGYVVPDEVQEIRELLVESSPESGSLGVPYGAARTSDLAQGALHYLWLGGLYLAVGGGIYARDADGEGANLVSIFPVPTESGLAITARVVVRPAALTLTAALSTPPEFDDALIAGAIATGVERTEGRPDLAVPLEAKFSAACQELLDEDERRYRGSGPAEIRVKGFNA